MKERIIRVCMTIIGVVIGGLSVGLFKHSQFGTDPFQCFANGMHNILPFSFGTLYIILNAILLIVVFFLKKHYIGIGTIINLFLVGFIVEFSHGTLQELIPNPSMMVRIVMLAVGFVILCISSSFYITADLGVSTYDAIALIMTDKKVAKFQYCRIATDVISVLVGFFLGAIVGVGTVMTAFLMGPFIAFFRSHISEPLLQKAIKEKCC